MNAMRKVRMIADIAGASVTLRSGEVYEMPDADALALIDMGWAEPDDMPAVELTVQTPREHATALRQRRQ